MTDSGMNTISVAELVQRFAELALQQDYALDGDVPEATRLFWELEDIEAELKRRPGDQRTGLLALYEHSNMQVRVTAAKATLAVAPQAARAQLQAIHIRRTTSGGGSGHVDLRS
jgi:cytochrome c oxidase assembly protein Cox11